MLDGGRIWRRAATKTISLPEGEMLILHVSGIDQD